MRILAAAILIFSLLACSAAKMKNQPSRDDLPVINSPNKLSAMSLKSSPFFDVQRSPSGNDSETYKSYVDGQQFGYCIAKTINSLGSENYFHSRILKAQTIRAQIIKNSQMVAQVEQSLGFFEKRIWEESSFASLPFIDFSSSKASLLLSQFPLQNTLFDTYTETNRVNPVDRQDLVDLIKSAAAMSKSFDASSARKTGDIYIDNMQKAASLSNPVVVWLISHPKASVTHFDLFRFALAAYDNDPFTALGVIGELFWQEVLTADPHRSKNAVLASKMVPLISPATSNPVGDNYHFWRILTAAYYQGGTFLGRVYSRIDSKEPGHLAANAVGLDTADATLAGIGKDVSCDLQ